MQDFNRTGDSEVPSGEVRRLLKEENDGLLLEKLKYEHRTQTHKVWMDGFNDIWLEKRELVETKIHYIHNNPLQPHWGLAEAIMRVLLALTNSQPPLSSQTFVHQFLEQTSIQ
jgi:hypothetical protein